MILHKTPPERVKITRSTGMLVQLSGKANCLFEYDATMGTLFIPVANPALNIPISCLIKPRFSNLRRLSKLRCVL